MAYLEIRFKNAGFVYTGDTRLVLTPKWTVTNDDADKSSNDLVLCAALNWPVPTAADIGPAIDVVKKKFPDRNLFVDSNDGLVPVYEPPPAA